MSNKFNSPFLKNFKPEDYFFFGLWKQLMFSAVFWVSCFNKKILNDLGLKAENLGACVLLYGNFFVKKTELENINNQISQKIEDGDEEFFQNMVNVANNVYTSAIEYSKTLHSKSPTIGDFEEFLQVAKSVNFLWLLGAEQFTVTAENKLQDAVVEAAFPAEDVPKIIPRVVTPLYHQHQEVVAFKKEIGDRTLAEVKEDTKLYAKLEQHLRMYPWIEVMNFMGEPLTMERLYEQIIHTKDDDVVATTITEGVSEKITLRARIMSHCGYIKQAGAEHFAILSEKALPFLNAIAKTIGVTYKEFLLLHHDDVRDALQDKMTSTQLKEIARNRQDMNTMIFTGEDNREVFVDQTQDIEMLKQEMLPKNDSSNQEIRGQVGNPGKYTGKVAIIMNIDDFPKLQIGDVLVTTMTTPDFVILMQKAGAIVTDIGGILCHAAIVSREINKPCVIGVKFGTKILKDGDIVEVDATAGIVKIIN